MKQVIKGEDWRIQWVTTLQEPYFQWSVKEEMFRVVRRGSFVVQGKHKRHDRLLSERMDLPVGFRTDFASLPFGMGRKSGVRAAAVHDFMYSGNSKFDFSLANSIFYKMLLEGGMSRWKARVWYSAVSVFGRLFYKKRKG